jgi:hypothetical protein
LAQTSHAPKLRLFEALELRSEYDARIKTLQECLPEARENRGWLRSLSREENRRPGPGFELAAAREELARLELKRRKLNVSIQQTNFQHQVEIDDERVSLGEALEIRKRLNQRIGELHAQSVASAWQRVIYKEGRDIVEPPEVPYDEATRQLDDARIAFRSLNRKLRVASFEVAVDYRDD